MNGHACFANLSPAIVPVDVGSVIVLMSRSKTVGTYKDKERHYESMETIVLNKQG